MSSIYHFHSPKGSPQTIKVGPKLIFYFNIIFCILLVETFEEEGKDKNVLKVLV